MLYQFLNPMGLFKINIIWISNEVWQGISHTATLEKAQLKRQGRVANPPKSNELKLSGIGIQYMATLHRAAYWPKTPKRVLLGSCRVHWHKEWDTWVHTSCVLLNAVKMMCRTSSSALPLQDRQLGSLISIVPLYYRQMHSVSLRKRVTLFKCTNWTKLCCRLGNCWFYFESDSAGPPYETDIKVKSSFDINSMTEGS